MVQTNEILRPRACDDIVIVGIANVRLGSQDRLLYYICVVSYVLNIRSSHRICIYSTRATYFLAGRHHRLFNMRYKVRLRYFLPNSHIILCIARTNIRVVK